jgi:hypothetical protein
MCALQQLGLLMLLQSPAFNQDKGSNKCNIAYQQGHL